MVVNLPVINNAPANPRIIIAFAQKPPVNVPAELSSGSKF